MLRKNETNHNIFFLWVCKMFSRCVWLSLSITEFSALYFISGNYILCFYLLYPSFLWTSSTAVKCVDTKRRKKNLQTFWTFHNLYDGCYNDINYPIKITWINAAGINSWCMHFFPTWITTATTLSINFLLIFLTRQM